MSSKKFSKSVGQRICEDFPDMFKPYEHTPEELEQIARDEAEAEALPLRYMARIRTAYIDSGGIKDLEEVCAFHSKDINWYISKDYEVIPHLEIYTGAIERACNFYRQIRFESVSYIPEGNS